LTSDPRQLANQANAKSSTGPKTAAGKTRAAQNALRHGLNVLVLSDPGLAPEVEAMARKISRLYADNETLEQARRIAEAQVDLNRVRDSRRRLIIEFLTDPNYQPFHVLRHQLRLSKMKDRVDLDRGPFKIDEIEAMTRPRPLEGEEKLAAILGERASQLAALDRYERRAWSRRKFAIRRFDVARAYAVARQSERVPDNNPQRPDETMLQSKESYAALQWK
jgi:hypothetical protein